MNDVTAELKKRSDSFQLQCVEGVNNVLDYIEFSLENYTLPPSEEGKIANAIAIQEDFFSFLASWV